MKSRLALLVLLLALVVAGQAVAQKEGGSIGKVITIGEDRIVLEVHNKGQMTFEVQTVQDGDQRVPDRAQLAQIKTLKAEQMVHVKWVQAHDGHYYIQEMFAGPAEGANPGLVTGSILAVSEGRIVVAKDEGGQITLETTWIRRQGKHLRDPFQEAAASQLKPGDKAVAMWQLGEGPHYILRGISKVAPEGQALGIVLLQAELRENYNLVNECQNTINQLNNLLNQLKKQLEGQEQ